jgi:hypothetical protein
MNEKASVKELHRVNSERDVRVVKSSDDQVGVCNVALASIARDEPVAEQQNRVVVDDRRRESFPQVGIQGDGLEHEFGEI